MIYFKSLDTQILTKMSSENKPLNVSPRNVLANRSLYMKVVFEKKQAKYRSFSTSSKMLKMLNSLLYLTPTGNMTEKEDVKSHRDHIILVQYYICNSVCTSSPVSCINYQKHRTKHRTFLILHKALSEIKNFRNFLCPKYTSS